jgi:putative NADH-flavin reductase
MRLFVLGATGGIGRHVVARGLENRHEIVAFVRSPEKLDGVAATILKGDVRDVSQLQAAMAGCDAVISSVGPPIPFTGKTTIMGDVASATAHAMKAAGVRRVLSISGDLQFPSGGPPKLVRMLLLRNLERDQAQLERVWRASDLEWTIVRPARLTNQAVDACRDALEAMPERPRPIARASVARFLIATAESGQHARQIVGLAR